MKEEFKKRSLTEYQSLKGECPYHRAGWCHNPLFQFPTAKYTNPDRCQTIMHKTCRWYIIAKEYGDKL